MVNFSGQGDRKCKMNSGHEKEKAGQRKESKRTGLDKVTWQTFVAVAMIPQLTLLR